MYIGLYRNCPGVISWWITVRTNGPYSHASFVLDDEEVWHATWPELMRADNLRHSVEQLGHKQATIDLYELIDLQPQQAEEIVKYLHELKGTPYDWWGLICFKRRRDWHSEHKLFCSEAIRVVTDYEKVRFHLFPDLNNPPAHKTSPNDLVESKQIKMRDSRLIIL